MTVKITKSKIKKVKKAREPRRPLDTPDSSESAHKRLLTLGQERIDELTARMVEGVNLTALANTIQKKWGEMTDVKLITLIKELSRFRKDRVDGKLLYLAKTTYGEMVANSFGENLDVLANLTKLVQIQQERVTKIIQTEMEKPYLYQTTKFEIQTLASMYGQLSSLQMDLGMIKRVPKEYLIANVEVAASKAQEVIEKAMKNNENVERTLSKAFKLIEGEFTEVSDDAAVSTPTLR